MVLHSFIHYTVPYCVSFLLILFLVHLKATLKTTFHCFANEKQRLSDFDSDFDSEYKYNSGLLRLKPRQSQQMIQICAISINKDEINQLLHNEITQSTIILNSIEAGLHITFSNTFQLMNLKCYY